MRGGLVCRPPEAPRHERGLYNEVSSAMYRVIQTQLHQAAADGISAMREWCGTWLVR